MFDFNDLLKIRRVCDTERNTFFIVGDIPADIDEVLDIELQEVFWCEDAGDFVSIWKYNNKD